MKKIEVLTIKDFELWQHYLSKLPVEQQDVYFQPEYYKLYEANGDGSARCFVFQQGDDIALYPFMVNCINELGYELNKEYYDIQGAYGYNGVISSSYDPVFIQCFYQAFHEYVYDNNIVCEFVRFHPVLNNVRFSKGFMEIVFDRFTISLDLEQGYESIWQNEYSSNNRNMIRKSIKSEVVCSIEEVEDFIDDFKNIYLGTMEKLRAEEEYFFSDQYFSSFVNEMSKNSKIITCKLGEKVLSASMIMFFGRYAHYHLSGRSRDCKENFVNNQMLDAAIRYLIEEKKISILHFGGGRSKHENDSLLSFKKNFSKKLAEFYIGKKVHNQDVYDRIVMQWKEKYPKAAERYSHMLQGYRKIDNSLCPSSCVLR